MSPIIDTFGRKHTYLRISLTDRCNLRCFYCMPEEGLDLMDKSHIMSLEEIEEMSRVFVEMGVDTIRLTGGEPLVRKNVDTLLHKLSALPVALKMTTNGILLDAHMDALEQAGVSHLNISLDTLDKVKNLFMSKRDEFDRIMKNLEQAIRLGFHIKINVVLMKGINEREIPAFIRFSQEKNIEVKFIEFMPFKGNQWDWEKCVSEQEILSSVQHHIGPIEQLETSPHSTSARYRVKGFQGSFGIISTVTNPFCSGCNRLRLTADGHLKTCLFAHEETDLLTPLRKGQDIRPLILSAIQTKKFSRDGMDVLVPEKFEKNRSMISIGG